MSHFRSECCSAKVSALVTLPLVFLCLAISQGTAAVITFNSGINPNSEAGFTYSTLPGGTISLVVNHFEGSGTLRITADDSSLFTFSGLDYANSLAGGGHFSLAIPAYGLRDGLVVGSASYSLTTNGSLFNNLTTFDGGTLAGINIDELRIGLSSGTIFYDLCFCGYNQAIDNVRLGDAISDSPEPAPGVLMLIGLSVIAQVLTRRRTGQDRATT